MKWRSSAAPFLAVVLVLLFFALPHAQAQQPTSRVIPFQGVATTIAPSSPGQALTIQLWDAAATSPGTLLFSEAQTLDVDATGAISFVFGSQTANGLDPANFPSGASRFLDVVDSTGASVVLSPPGRIALNAVAFALSPGPQGPPGVQGPPGQQGPPGVVQAVSPGDASIVVAGTATNPTVAVAANGITNSNVANGALSPAKIAGIAATLGPNMFTGTQSIVGNVSIRASAGPALAAAAGAALVVTGSVGILPTSATANPQLIFGGDGASAQILVDAPTANTPAANLTVAAANGGPAGVSSFNGGALTLSGGDGSAISGFGGAVTIRAGAGVAPGGFTGGRVFIRGGNSTGSSGGGDVFIQPGSSFSGSDGTTLIQGSRINLLPTQLSPGPGGVGVGLSFGSRNFFAKLSVEGAESTLNGTNAAISLNNTLTATNFWLLRAGAPGTATPDGGFSIGDASALRLVITPQTNGALVGIGINSPTNGITLPNIAGAVGQGLANAWTTYSSRRWKSNIETMQGALDKVERLRGVAFRWKQNGQRDIGLIAEEVGEVIPEVVTYEENGTDATGLDYTRLTALLVEAIKEQQAQIRKLTTELGELKAKLIGQPVLASISEPEVQKGLEPRHQARE